MFSSVEEATQKLSNTVIIYNNEPVYVQEGRTVNRKVGIKVLEYWNGGGIRTYTLDDPLLNYKDLGDRIGYLNYKDDSYNEAIYCSRMPVRRAHSTQGIGSENLQTEILKGDSVRGIPTNRLSWNRLYPTPGFAKMLRRDYPTIPEIEEEMKKDSSLVSKAFSRQWAFLRDPTGVFFLEYRGAKVGYFFDFSKLNFSEDYSYLKPNFQKKFPELKVA